MEKGKYLPFTVTEKSLSPVSYKSSNWDTLIKGREKERLQLNANSMYCSLIKPLECRTWSLCDCHPCLIAPFCVPCETSFLWSSSPHARNRAASALQRQCAFLLSLVPAVSGIQALRPAGGRKVAVFGSGSWEPIPTTLCRWQERGGEARLGRRVHQSLPDCRGSQP